MEFSESSTAYLTRKIRVWSKTNSIDFPWRRTNNMWHALVAEVMLQRTRASQVVPVYIQFSRNFPTPGSYCSSKDTQQKNFFANLGLAWRYEVFQKTAAHFAESAIPDTKEALMKIPGIGDYIASAYLSFHHGKREFLIDSNIVRLYSRFFGFDSNNETRRKKWFQNLADQITPPRKVGPFNYALLDFSMNICTQSPKCQECSMPRKCHYFKKNGV